MKQSNTPIKHQQTNKKYIAFLINCFFILQLQAQHNAIYSGIPWFDDRGKIVSAHGACIIKNNNKFYLFGEAHDDSTNSFAGFNCYSSTNLYNWKFESIALPLQDTGALSINTVGERVKVMQCPTTGEYVMYMHCDNMQYKGQFLGYATSANITGPYSFKGPLLFNNKMIKKWDMGTFKDEDGTGYVLLHGADIYKLSNDYKSIVEQIHKATQKGFEAPTLFKKDSLYYFIGSDLTGWERNDNYYLTANSLNGPWIKRGFITPEGTLTWNSQTTFVLPIQGNKQTTYLYMGDRWSFPKQASAATYVWQPITINGFNISIPNYAPAWQVDITTGENNSFSINGKTFAATHAQIKYRGSWKQDTLGTKSSHQKDASMSFTFKGKQVALYGLTKNNGGYAMIEVVNKKGKIMATTAIDMYCKYTTSQLKFVSPMLPLNTYTIKVKVLAEHWWWQEKSGKKSGSLGNVVAIEKIVISN